MDEYEICYGSLYDAVAKVLISAEMPREIAGVFKRFPLQRKNHYYALYSEAGTEFGILDTRTSSSLDALKDYPKARFEAVFLAQAFTKRRHKGKPGSQLFPVSINIFGLKSTANEAAYRLSKASAFLQHPQSLNKEAIYNNPQFLTFDENLNMSIFIGQGSGNMLNSKTKISEEINDILESLTYVAADEDLEPPVGLSSKLKRMNTLPFISFGGLIADTMGLGKTLTMLAAILRSVPAAELFSSFYDKPENERPQKLRIKATLVIVPSSQLLESWQSEIQTHILPGALSFVCFHGKKRPRNNELLSSFDVVLTTYATLAADYAHQGILHQMEWYRVVLDEGGAQVSPHWIKNSGTRQFRASAALCTKRRWCLTGTPIQNRLEDLASLAQFLQLPNIATKVVFQKHILSPLSEGGADFAKPLRAYLEAYCLRRSEKCLNLPTSSEVNVTLSLSPEEQCLYKCLLDETRREIDSLVSKGIETRSNKLFTAMLKLRMLCNLGTFFSARSNTSTLGRSYPETECEHCQPSSEEARLLQDDYSVCSYCGKPLYRSSPSPIQNSIQGSDAGNISDDSNTPSSGETQAMIEQKNPTLSVGYSTKLSAVVQKVTEGGTDNKSIVFSYWTSTLDILRWLFEQAGISCRQVDGKVGPIERSIRLRAFKEDPRVHVLLMSIGTGAVGLNLAVANQVHIVEPQWNPSVEEQAIARALRMGQTREVTIFRYIMEKTVEQNIVSLQRKKKHIAKFTFDAETQETQSGALEDLKFVLDMGSV
ncbi:putative SWI/SNF-related matrix-associated actin-dependent regulator of chromatin subfamily A member 3-like 2 [Daldinia childiae]|uniref:putative SWI/SNF-related matrix-associated actin-dependent regulator of chromatin subfamily A member 3-like 2 n=1 Tax=Daldinia childiae TaxID=326645 RepID=UPI0014450E4C|nr:putative SWI/SNF-related matrix-associated actin-dependent regulator of chromatin subfamily A member 3-like 2 [Daldinia childiae]KAF3058712.1 putative SWI/SNF-related matrix-associated actin-dependent regulator of chromatin subfamily A member 3-like 2 [Daldinia childiae]